MEQTNFEIVTQTLTGIPTRRDFLRGLVAAGLGFGGLRRVGAAEAKKKGKKKRKKKLQPRPLPPPSSPPSLPPLILNRFGCVEVGQPCRGDSSLCCSGVCAGAAPAEGQPDSSTCAAHNTSGCTADTNTCDFGPDIPCNPGQPGYRVCLLTTGNAGFCGDVSAGATTHCRVCSRDVDCQGEFGPGAACVFLGGTCTPLCITTNRTACVPAGI
jgi:hypothetical protein